MLSAGNEKAESNAVGKPLCATVDEPLGRE